MRAFTYNALPGRVVFGTGRTAELGAEVARLGLDRVMLIASPRQIAATPNLDPSINGRCAGTFDRIVMHSPAEVQEELLAEARRLDIDGAVAIGGGSAIGLAKAIAARTGRPIIAIPTTYSGSEMTTIWGVTEGGIKHTERDPRVLPRTVIYDPDLVADMPAHLAGPSGMNAIAHCVEALYAEDANPITSMKAEEGIRALADGLSRVVTAPGDREATGRALYGAWLAGAALATVTMALHHKLCHTLGGSFDLPHAETHTIVLPHVTAFNAPAAPEAIGRVAEALDAGSAAAGLFDLATTVGAPTALEDIGMREEDLDRAAELAVQNPYYNPRPVDREAVRALLDDAFHGRRPE